MGGHLKLPFLDFAPRPLMLLQKPNKARETTYKLCMFFLSGKSSHSSGTHGITLHVDFVDFNIPYFLMHFEQHGDPTTQLPHPLHRRAIDPSDFSQAGGREVTRAGGRWQGERTIERVGRRG